MTKTLKPKLSTKTPKAVVDYDWKFADNCTWGWVHQVVRRAVDANGVRVNLRQWFAQEQLQ